MNEQNLPAVDFFFTFFIVIIIFSEDCSATLVHALVIVSFMKELTGLSKFFTL